MTKRLLGFVAILLLGMINAPVSAQELKIATFAGGCFWCVESDFDKVPGVVKTVSGFTGGTVTDPTYGQVTAGGTGHREAVRIAYDPSKVTYAELLTVFWHSVDPTDDGGQFCDRGESYKTAIFTGDDHERRLAEASKRAAEEALETKVATSIEMAGPFYAAEDYHQDYYQKSRLKYQYYRWACGRNQRVEEVWGERAYHGIPNHG